MLLTTNDAKVIIAHITRAFVFPFIPTERKNTVYAQKYTAMNKLNHFML